MSHWEQVQSTLEKGFFDLVGFGADWFHDKSIARCAPFGVMSILAQSHSGIDDLVREYDATDDVLLQTRGGIRQFTWRIQVESDSHSPCKAAWYYLERARTKLRFDSFQSLIHDCDISLVGDAGVVNLDYERDGRWVSRSSMDVFFETTVELTDCSVEHIDIVLVSSDLKDVDGSALPTALQCDNEVIQ